ncbi:MAG: hypothetical protein QM764_00435 [Chitinophagaceae bacterium]
MNSVVSQKLKNTSPFLLFLPFLLLYIVIILLFHPHQIADDEIRYTGYAHNLLHGYYSEPPPNVAIINGPGYPIVLMPFVAINAPIVWMVLLNAIFYYISVVYLFKALRQIASFGIAFAFSLFWACYYNSFQDMLNAFTESLTCMIISLLLYFLTHLFFNQKTPKKKYLYFAGISLGYLVLTKIIFGYVLLILLIASFILWLLKRQSVILKRNLLFLLIAFATITPYLAYTFSLTGEIFYLGNPGADALYWMSSPYETEFGDWRGFPKEQQGVDPYRVPYYQDSLTAHHKLNFEIAHQFDGARQDSVYTKMAKDNIKAHPSKFIQNWISNVGRILFSFPNSYTLQNNKTLFRLPLNGIIVVLSLFCIIPTLLNWRNVNFMVRLLLFFTLIYLGGSSLVSGLTRMFTIVVPILLFWMAFILPRTLSINWRFNKNQTPPL